MFKISFSAQKLWQFDIINDFQGFTYKMYGQNTYRIYSQTVLKILTDSPCHVEEIMDI